MTGLIWIMAGDSILLLFWDRWRVKVEIKKDTNVYWIYDLTLTIYFKYNTSQVKDTKKRLASIHGETGDSQLILTCSKCSKQSPYIHFMCLYTKQGHLYFICDLLNFCSNRKMFVIHCAKWKICSLAHIYCLKYCMVCETTSFWFVSGLFFWLLVLYSITHLRGCCSALKQENRNFMEAKPIFLKCGNSGLF